MLVNRTVSAYFHAVMKKRFLHIYKQFLVSVLLAGFMAHLVMPISGKAQKTAFTQWLNQNVVATGDTHEAQLRDTINKLPREATDFDGLVQKASELIATHKNEFRIHPVSAEQYPDKVTSWLVSQWTVFQYQQTGDNAVQSEPLKVLQKWTSQQNPGSDLSATLSNIRPAKFYSLNDIRRILPAFYSLIPLVSGISINAP